MPVDDLESPAQRGSHTLMSEPIALNPFLKLSICIALNPLILSRHPALNLNNAIIISKTIQYVSINPNVILPKKIAELH